MSVSVSAASPSEKSATTRSSGSGVGVIIEHLILLVMMSTTFFAWYLFGTSSAAETSSADDSVADIVSGLSSSNVYSFSGKEITDSALISKGLEGTNVAFAVIPNAQFNDDIPTAVFEKSNYDAIIFAHNGGLGRYELEVRASSNVLGDKLNMIVGEGLPSDPGALISENVASIRQAVASSGS